MITLSRVPGPARSDWKAWVGRRSLIVGPRIGFLCNPIRLKFSTKGKRFPSWEAGQSWGLRLYQSGYDNGLLFTIKLKVQPIQTGPSQGIGHTPVLVPREPTQAPPEPSLPIQTTLLRSTLQKPMSEMISPMLKTIKTRYLT